MNDFSSHLINSTSEYEVTFNIDVFNPLDITDEYSKIAVLVSSEYEGIFINGGIGTYYKNLAKYLSIANYSVFVLLCYSSKNEYEIPINEGYSKFLFTKDAKSFLNLNDEHFRILNQSKNDSFDHESFISLFTIQAFSNTFRKSLIYVEFHEMLGIGYRTIQAKNVGILGKNVITAVTLHSNSEWLSEINERYTEDNVIDYWKKCFYEQYSFENSNLAFFPSIYLKNKVTSYKWDTVHSIHMQNFIPLVTSLNDFNIKKINRIRMFNSLLKSEKPKIIFFGRLEERKGLHTFIKALNLLQDSLQDQFNVIFLGKIISLQSSKYSNYDSRQYIKNSISQNIRYEIISELNSSEALALISSLYNVTVCLASHQENFPNTALEVAQIPVKLIVSQIEGFVETLEFVNRTSEVYWFESQNPTSLSKTISEATFNVPHRINITTQDFIKKTNLQLLERKLSYIEKSAEELDSIYAEKLRENPKISIGVTCFNLGDYLFDCLQSIENQTYKNLDVIILDDCSDDISTKEKFALATKKFCDFKFIRLDQNLGLGGARNYLIYMAEGKYFIPLDADNIMFPFAVEEYVKAILLSGAKTVSCRKKDFGEYNDGYTFTGGLLPSLMFTNVAGDAFSIFDINVLRNFKHCEDRKVKTHDWQILTSLVGVGEKIAYYPFPLYLYRVRQDSMLRNASPAEQRFYLRIYLSHLPLRKISERQIFMLLMALEQLLSHKEMQIELSIFSWNNYLRKLYLILSGGGVANMSPNFFQRLLIFIRSLFKI